ncbi:hypothetical protein LOTGIDRAFT_160972 [Lottia gigantea]|uniref:Uncharacterized protein n=1 Tax=Lottia gigantea TaxID=225164 RepID=V3ZTF4_LOTGI|nr:hypothetical protein LOTGIDRAFT_160972 [Lottia gigantea]ESO94738.1 hypothetical protein LOTGIDRAFT_160972 [Lottia gigantea]
MSNKEQLFVITSNKSDIKLSLDYEYELDRNQEYELGLKYFSVYNSFININENNNQIKISTDNGVTFKTISLLPGRYNYAAINEYLSEYGGSVNSKNNIEFKGTVIKASKPRSCTLDPFPTNILKDNLPDIIPVITDIATSTVPDIFKIANVTPLIKKSTLDPNVLKNYRTVSKEHWAYIVQCT